MACRRKTRLTCHRIPAAPRGVLPPHHGLSPGTASALDERARPFGRSPITLEPYWTAGSCQTFLMHHRISTAPRGVLSPHHGLSPGTLSAPGKRARPFGRSPTGPDLRDAERRHRAPSGQIPPPEIDRDSFARSVCLPARDCLRARGPAVDRRTCTCDMCMHMHMHIHVN